MSILKASLHLHTNEDPEDGELIKYSTKELIDQAKQLDFQVLAITWHNKLLSSEEISNYAKAKNIILLPGIELSLKKSRFKQAHILIIGADILPDIKTIDELKAWRINHPEPLIIAPHPNFLVQSLGLKKLRREQNLIDAIEHSWFYTKYFNQNKKTAQLAQEINKPLIATSDLHDIKYLKDDYCLIETKSSNNQDIISAIKKGRVTNVTRPKKIFEMIKFVLYFMKPRSGKKL